MNFPEQKINNINILIVEDELLIAKNLSQRLEKFGYKIADVVSSGADAIHRAGELKPDLILMDIVIKGEIDGIATAAIIHQQLDIPIIYTTAYADDETLQRAENTGSYGYLLKPFKEREMHATIKIALSKHQEAVEMQKLMALAAAKSENRTRFVSMAYHDLNTPLTTIQLSAEMLEDSDLKISPGTTNKNVNRIKKAVSNMSELLDDILMLSKAEAGKLSLNLNELNVTEFCTSILEELQPIVTDKHLVTFLAQTEPLHANLDAKLLHQLLTNLLSNAIKYSPNGGSISLELSCENQQIIFCVRDEGIGMTAGYEEKLFQQFERGANVGKIKGSGLGLCIVKHIVDLHGGTISVESAIGKGTTFIVALPFLVIGH
ncbi:MAG: response regulator [Microcoleus sp. PH2017_29_MFU_D_A]|jgi:signal transduction histidine kinase|uniref:hybrid sensor histidine kinase/response regulator n=1 Tax=unclassified Microcoleus TaxID=2642155 RepID=UPI001D5753B1|nr:MULTISPECIES: ATP-binding protein [unclassified Microcoleus]MCC3586921.1 response regulator [Microcoleus sp. PH2017_30_WIL_O_A]MCC3606103.1 response regulator [Microcoleus sp. PH2017_29_MFU_D_A]MCC3637178.1 response regulator [Microcoleus sp. PH2017_37_MFU_D_B]